MVAEGVPTMLGMQAIGHKSEGAYLRYNRSIKAQVWVAQHCTSEENNYEEIVWEKTSHLRSGMINGKIDPNNISPSKRSKVEKASVYFFLDSWNKYSQARPYLVLLILNFIKSYFFIDIAKEICKILFATSVLILCKRNFTIQMTMKE